MTGRASFDRVRQTAMRLFGERGVRAVSVDEIALHSGLSKPTIYRNFASKDELVAACVAVDGRRRVAALAEAMSSADQTACSRFRTAAAYVAASFGQADYRGALASIAAIEFPHGDHPVRQAAQAAKTQMRDQMLWAAYSLPLERRAPAADQILLLIEGAEAVLRTLGADFARQALIHGVEAAIAAEKGGLAGHEAAPEILPGAQQA